MRDYVNEVLEQMNEKYIAEAAVFQMEKKHIRPRIVAAALVAARLMGVTAVAYSQGWIFEQGGPEVWADEETVVQAPAAEEEIPSQKYNYRVHFTAEAYDRFTEEQMALLDANYGQKLSYADLAEVKEELGVELLALRDFALGEQVTAEIVGHRGADQYKQVLMNYELSRNEENLRVVVDVSLKTDGIQNFSVGGSYARPIEEMEYWIEALGVNAKLVSAESGPTHIASVVWAYFTHDNMTYTVQIIDKDVPAEKFAEACALLENLHK